MAGLVNIRQLLTEQPALSSLRYAICVLFPFWLNTAEQCQKVEILLQTDCRSGIANRFVFVTFCEPFTYPNVVEAELLEM